MRAPIFDLCSADAAVGALLGAGLDTRLYSFGEAPEGVTRPYAVWQVITGSPENYLAGRPDVDGLTLQVDVYAKTGDVARQVRDAIRDAIELHAYITRWGAESRDPTTESCRAGFDAAWILKR
jgi:hypothetical protein